MALNLGNSNINDVKLGNTQVNKVCVGATQVWPTNFTYSLSNSLKNALISDESNNITRANNILITAHNAGSKYIEVDAYTFMESIELTASKKWMICQGSEASTLVEINSVQKI